MSRDNEQEVECRVQERTAALTVANEALRRELAERQPDERLRFEEQRYRSLVGAITAIVWNTPASGELETEQPGWSAFTGQTFAQYSGWGWLNAVHPDDRPETAQVWSAAVASRSMYHVEHRLRRHDGEYRHMLVRAVPILNDDGSIREWIGVHTDMTEQKIAEATLREAKAAAEAANRTKSEFLANMSHEIRTPMNGIIGMTELLLNTPLSAQQHDYLNTVKNSADALLRLLNDILDFSKIEAGRLELETIDFPVRDCLGDAMQILAMRAAQKGLELACAIAPETPDTLRGDPGRLRQIIVNLVGNAIKFTEVGEVVLEVGVATRTTSAVELHCTVRDTGIGIAADKVQRIFEPFGQADSSTTRRYGGTGLGVTISAQLVAMMGGRTWVESELGKGTAFHFLARFELPQIASRPTVVEPVRLRGMPVLVVDDNATNRRILEEVLRTWGMEPTLADGWRSAMQALDLNAGRQPPFRLILLDVMMPDVDGFGVAQEIRNRPDMETCALLMLSSAGQAISAERCRQLGIAGYLTKPIKQSDLLDGILAALGARKAPDRSTPQAPAGQNKAVTPRRILLAEDGLVNQRVAVGLLELRGHQVVVANNGREALAALGKQTFDVVLMDVQMPEMDGLQATAAIREQEKASGKHVPIIAMTAHAMQGDRDQCLQAGMDGYISKPFQAQVLYDVVEGCPSAIPIGGEKPTPGTPGQVLNRDLALQGVRGRADMLRKMLQALAQEMQELLPCIRQAVVQNDAASLVRPAHTLRGAAACCAAHATAAAAGTLETMGRTKDLHGAAEALAILENEVARLLPVLQSEMKE